MYKNYGLTGETVKVRRKQLGETKEAPWAYAEQYMRIIAEYPFFLVAQVLPHMNPDGFGLSKPYRVCLHKHDIRCGDILLNGGAIR